MKPILGRSLIAAGLACMMAFPALAHVSAEPTSRLGDPWWKTRYELLSQRAAQAGKSAKIVFLGDSITEGWENAGKEVWAQYYAPRDALNIGIGGDQTQHVLWRLEHGNIDGLAPKLVVLMIGTNNLSIERLGPSDGQIADGVATIVARLRTSLPGAKILLLGIFPRGENPNPMRGDALQVNQIIRKLADDKTVFYTDFGDRFIDAQGMISAELMPDRLHLSPAGYRIWAEAIETKVAEVLGEKGKR